jgi:cytochrome c biogenesis protein CcdA
MELPIFLFAIGLGLVDGILNPCALSVLFFLVAYLLAIGTSKKCLRIGIAYSSVVFVVYFLFMYGVLNVISIIGFIEIIKIIVASVLIVAGLLSLKDFFFYGKFVSLEIPKFAKPKIERLIKMATLPSAILLGVLVSFVEIPCAGSFPFAFITILAERGIVGTTAVLYLLLYNFFFVIPLILLVLIFYFGLQKVEKAEELRLKTRKHMRLVTGLILIVLGLAMLLRWI